MKRLTEKNVFSGLTTPWRLAICLFVCFGFGFGWGVVIVVCWLSG
jgi:hypothetical protein